MMTLTINQWMGCFLLPTLTAPAVLLQLVAIDAGTGTVTDTQMFADWVWEQTGNKRASQCHMSVCHRQLWEITKYKHSSKIFRNLYLTYLSISFFFGNFLVFLPTPVHKYLHCMLLTLDYKWPQLFLCQVELFKHCCCEVWCKTYASPFRSLTACF